MVMILYALCGAMVFVVGGWKKSGSMTTICQMLVVLTDEKIFLTCATFGDIVRQYVHTKLEKALPSRKVKCKGWL